MGMCVICVCSRNPTFLGLWRLSSSQNASWKWSISGLVPTSILERPHATITVLLMVLGINIFYWMHLHFANALRKQLDTSLYWSSMASASTVVKNSTTCFIQPNIHSKPWFCSLVGLNSCSEQFWLIATTCGMLLTQKGTKTHLTRNFVSIFHAPLRVTLCIIQTTPFGRALLNLFTLSNYSQVSDCKISR